MPEMNSWKAFYERIKQPAYVTDSTKGTTPIYQPIDNLSAAKSAYGNIVYNKAPSFLRQAEFYLGEDKFQTAVRAFLKKHAFGNATWQDLVSEFEAASGQDLTRWANVWVKQRGLAIFRITAREYNVPGQRDTTAQDVILSQTDALGTDALWNVKTQVLEKFNGQRFNSSSGITKVEDS
jgi:aminopeptidase N